MMKVPDVVSTTACRSFGFSCCGSNKRRNSMNDIVDSFYLEMFRQHTCLTSLCFPNSGNASGQIPLPKGEGAAKRRVRGEETSLCTPHPALRATLSLRERNSSRNIFLKRNTVHASRVQQPFGELICRIPRLLCLSAHADI